MLSSGLSLSALPPRNWRIGSPPPSQRPSRVMPTGTTSYCAGSSARMTDVADASDTACSSDCPPNSTATRMRRGGVAPGAGCFFSFVVSSSKVFLNIRQRSAFVLVPTQHSALARLLADNLDLRLQRDAGLGQDPRAGQFQQGQHI